jgi:hypothetical protein
MRTLIRSIFLLRLLKKTDVRVFFPSHFPCECMCIHSPLFFIKNLIHEMNLKNYTNSFSLLLAEILPFSRSLIIREKIRNRHCLPSEKMRFTLSARWIRNEHTYIHAPSHLLNRIRSAIVTIIAFHYCLKVSYESNPSISEH